MTNARDKTYRGVLGGTPAAWTKARSASESPSGHLKQFEKTMLPHFDAAYKVARWLTRNEHDAHDLVQESYLRAFRFYHSYQASDPRAWLLAIVRNTHRSWTRREKASQLAVVFDEATHPCRLGVPDPEKHLMDATRAQRLRDCIEALTPAHREILVMREFEEMSYRQIARSAGLRIGTVMSRLSRARKQLKQRVRYA